MDLIDKNIVMDGVKKSHNLNLKWMANMNIDAAIVKMTIRGFQTMGCKDDLKCAVASLVYLDLKEDGTLINLEKLYDYELDVIYFLGQQENCAPNIIVPTPSTEEIDMTKMEEIQSKLNSKANGFTIAICNPNSTILYYSMTNDFIEK